MKATEIDIRQVLQPVIGQKPARAKLGVGSFLTFDFGPLSREDHHLVGKWHLWIYQANWSLADQHRQIVNSDSERRYIALAIPRLQETKLSNVEVDPASLETVFRFGEFRLTVGRPDYLDDADERDYYWMFFLPGKQVLSVGPAGVILGPSDRGR